MRTLDDEADALRAVREHVAAAIKAMPSDKWDIPWMQKYWAFIDFKLDGALSGIDRALKEIGAT